MKTEFHVAGVLACGAFLLVGLNGYFRTENALHAILWGLGASGVLGLIGYKMGAILGHPKGSAKPKKSGTAYAAASSDPGRTPLTGEETFLDEI